MINYSQILTLNYPDTQWALYGEEYSGLEWYDSTPKKFGYITKDKTWQAR